MSPSIPAAIVIVQSDVADERFVIDQYGPDIAARVEAVGGDVLAIELVPLTGELFEERLQHYIDDGVPLIVTFGGTGIGIDDIVPELTSIIVERRVPGLEERLRRAISDGSPAAALERGACGGAEATLVVNLPRERMLAEAGLVEAATTGRERHYRLDPTPLLEVRKLLSDLGSGDAADASRVPIAESALDALNTEVYRTRRERRRAASPDRSSRHTAEPDVTSHQIQESG